MAPAESEVSILKYQSSRTEMSPGKDGEIFNMTRYFLMPESKSIKVGLLAQAPTGKGGERVYENLTIEHKTVKNIRVGE